MLEEARCLRTAASPVDDMRLDNRLTLTPVAAQGLNHPEQQQWRSWSCSRLPLSTCKTSYSIFFRTHLGQRDTTLKR
jgi:hypothetical protein